MSLWSLYVGVPSTRVPIDVTTLVSYVLPLIVCYFVVAVLVVTPQTRGARAVLFPVVAALGFRTMVSVDVSLGKPELKLVDAIFACTTFCFVMRIVDWTLANKALERHLRPENSTPSSIMDALDLATNMRGLGWDWSYGVHVPPETRPTSSRMAFAFSTLLSVVAHAFMFSIFHTVFLSFLGAESVTKGAIIIDESLPYLARYLRASIISACTAFMVYAPMQIGYDLITIFAVLFFGHNPHQWPPAFDAPWRATSLHDFWGRRWHQWARRIFLFLGGYPLSILFGQAGIVLGAFLASALLHDIAIVRLDSKVGAWWMLVGFGMMGPGLLAERAFYKLTGRRVGGVLGWVWTMTCLLTLGTVMFEGCARAGGGFDHSSLHINGGFKPVRILTERLAMDLNSWLYSI